MQDEELNLIQAAQNNDLVSLHKLLRNGTEVNIKDEYNRTPLHWACHGYGSQVCNEETPFHLVSYRGDLEIVHEL
jgi:hypothetical protein